MREKAPGGVLTEPIEATSVSNDFLDFLHGCLNDYYSQPEAQTSVEPHNNMGNLSLLTTTMEALTVLEMIKEIGSSDARITPIEPELKPPFGFASALHDFKVNP
jgi:hypothetical protein